MCCREINSVLIRYGDEAAWCKSIHIGATVPADNRTKALPPATRISMSENMYFLALFILFSAIVVGVRGLVFPLKPTIPADGANQIDGWTPKPTRRAAPNLLGDIDLPHLFARQTIADGIDQSTCGYISGNPSSSLTCPSGYGCGYISTSPLYFGCWPVSSGVVQTTAMSYLSACLDYSEQPRTGSAPMVVGSDLVWYDAPFQDASDTTSSQSANCS